MFKKILIGLAAVIGIIVLVAAIQSPEYKVSRSVVINASAETIFPFINSSEKMNVWMPWIDMDPSVKMTVSGPAEGVGSISAWDSTGDMGTGLSTVIESVPHQVVRTKIDYLKPMEMSQISEITLAPQASGTLVTWSVAGKNSLIPRIFCLFSSIDGHVGPAFEKGLSKLKTTIEK